MQNQFQPQLHQVVQNLQHAQVNQTSQPQAMLPKLNVKQQQQQPQQHPPLQQTQSKTGPIPHTTNVSAGKESPQVAPKFIELPKIDPNSQQLFSLNTITNQITQLSPGLTTAALGPMERLLIVPAGINAQQLAQCLLQGQIHFNNIGQAAQAPIPSSQQSIQPLQQQPQQTVQQHSMQQIQQQQQPPPPLQSPNVGNMPTKKVQPAVENKPRKAKPRAKKTEAVKPVQQVVQPLPKTNQMDIKPQNQTDMQKHNNVTNQPRPPSNSSFPTQSSAAPPIQFNSHHNQTSGPQQNVQIVRPSIQQPAASPLARTTANNISQQLISTGSAANPAQRMTMNQPRPTIQLQTNQMQMQMNHQQLSNGPNMSAASMSAVPPLVSVHPIPQQHIVGSQSHQSNQPRVQTIQLTPQKQQLLKNVQMQIQSLSARLQNKSLLSTLTIPPDFDLNNPIHNKPLPMLSNMNAMSDTEIHQALQRLFIEQQKILATGKVIAPMSNAQPSFASGPVNTQPSTATAKPAIQYGQAPTSNTLPTKPSAVVPTTTTKPKPKSRAKANKTADASKTTIPMSVAPQITTPTLVNRQATIRMTTTPLSVPTSEQIKSPVSTTTTTMIQHNNQSYTLQNTNVSSQPSAFIVNNQQQQQQHIVSNQVTPSSVPMPRLTHPSSLTIVPATSNIASTLIRQPPPPSHLTMTLQPVVPKGVLIQPLSQSQIPQQPTPTIQKQQPPNKINNAQLKIQTTQQQQQKQVIVMSSSGNHQLVQQQSSGQNESQPLNDHAPSDVLHSQSTVNQSQTPTPAPNQQPEEPDHSQASTVSPSTNNQTVHDSTPIPSSPAVEHQPPASPKMKVPRHCL